MFCNKCGTQLPEQAGFCPNCGERMGLQVNRNGNQETNKQTSYIQNDKKSKNRFIGMSAVGIVIILAIVVVLFLFGGRDYKKVIDVYVKASFSNDAKTIEKMFQLLPEEMLEGVLIVFEDEKDIVGIEEVVEYIQETKEDYMDSVEEQFGEDYTYTYEIVQEEECSKTKIRKLNDTYSENLEELDIDWEREIEEAKSVTIEITVSSKDGENSITTEMTIMVIKIGRSWYLDLEEIGL